jgi:phosphatidylserine decarboxylase
LLWLKTFLIRSFIKNHSINRAELKDADLRSYASLNDFFTRQLHPDSYAIDRDLQALIAPGQGCIGPVYQLNKEFFCDSKNLWLKGEDLVSATYHNSQDLVRMLSLSPADYHRIHAPCDGMVVHIQRHRDNFLSAHSNIVSFYPKLLEENERISLTIKTVYGFVSVVLIGARFVGSIQLIEGKNVPFFVQRGDELACFKLGSTVVLLTPSSLKYYLYEGKIQLGARLGLFEVA